jgi:hypothetical protein
MANNGKSSGRLASVEERLAELELIVASDSGLLATSNG